MKPHELIAALMQREGLGALPLAKRLNKPGLQPQIHRYVHGLVAAPSRSTAVPIAGYFHLPVDALYDEKVATQIARERGITALPPTPIREQRSRSRPAGLGTLSDEAVRRARKWDAMDERSRKLFDAMLGAAGLAIDDAPPSATVKALPPALAAPASRLVHRTLADVSKPKAVPHHPRKKSST